MIKILFKLLGLCDHRYKIIRDIDVVDELGDKLYTKYHLQCEKCGKLKTKKMT